MQGNFVREERKSWTMVADTTSLLDSESRKSLQLLQGLKGTRLVIPKMGNKFQIIPNIISLVVGNFRAICSNRVSFLLANAGGRLYYQS